MASSSTTPTLYSSRFFISTSTLRRRLPLVGAFCMLTLGISNLYSPLYSSALKTGPVPFNFNFGFSFLSILFCWIDSVVYFRSKLSSRFSTKSSNFIRMEGNTNNTTVPSIVVYVTVPNKEAGKSHDFSKFLLFFFIESI
jgi:periplasmic divalent cation tolerance protein